MIDDIVSHRGFAAVSATVLPAASGGEGDITYSVEGSARGPVV